MTKRAEQAGRTLAVKISGLLGGHTGLVIHEGRSNAVKWVARLLMQLRKDGVDFRLVSIDGGEKHNAIPDNATAVIVTADEKFEEKINKINAEILRETKAIETKNPKLEITAVDAKKPMTKEDSDKVLNLVLSIYHGVWQMHPEIKGLVNTSQSLSVVKTEGDMVKMQVYARTNEATQMDWLLETNRALANLAGVEIVVPPEDIMGPWPAALDAKIVDLSKNIYKRMFNQDVKVVGIHAGLECGCIQNRGYPDMECISYGPEIVGAHSIEENMSIDTACKCYELTLEIIKEWAK
jgi:dipeptidase D